MFRKPREDIDLTSSSPLVPSTGRAPTPPSSTKQSFKTMSSSNTSNIPTLASVTPLSGRSKLLARGGGKTKGKTNGNILSFFKKAESVSTTYAKLENKDQSLFLDEWDDGKAGDLTQTPTPPREDLPIQEPSVAAFDDARSKDLSRFNESTNPSKRRRLDASAIAKSPTSVRRDSQKRGPFIEDSDSDEEDGNTSVGEINSLPEAVNDEASPTISTTCSMSVEAAPSIVDAQAVLSIPHLKWESTSLTDDNDFDGIEDFVDDEFPEDGEEFRERKWMEEQELELGLGDEQDPNISSLPTKEEPLDSSIDIKQEREAALCPICNASFAGIADQVRCYPFSYTSTVLTLPRRPPFM